MGVIVLVDLDPPPNSLMLAQEAFGLKSMDMIQEAIQEGSPSEDEGELVRIHTIE